MTEASAPAALLAHRLRVETRVAHVEAEAALDLGCRLLDLQGYGALLLGLHAFHTGAEERLRRVRGWSRLRPAVDPVARERASLLKDDLDRLGLTARSDQCPAVRLPDLKSMAAALGCLYVIEGSRLGGRVIARQARATLGDDVPVAFFSGGGRVPTTGGWRALQDALDAFGAAQGETGRATAVAAAKETFAAFTDCLSHQVQTT